MIKDVAPKADRPVVRQARALRRRMTLPEVLLWRVLRSQPLGIKFRRQHPSGIYVLDFFCIDARLAIEIDGVGHDRGNRPQRDAVRDTWLAEQGVLTMRLPAAEVLRNTDAAAASVLDAARGRLPLHHPAAPGGPPPRGKLGED